MVRVVTVRFADALVCVYSIHSLGLVGHIEDIAVAKDQQGKKLGMRIIQALDYVAEQVGCYKVSLFASLFLALFLSERGRKQWLALVNIWALCLSQMSEG